MKQCCVCNKKITNKETLFCACDNFQCSRFCNIRYINKIKSKDSNFQNPTFWKNIGSMKRSSSSSLLFDNNNEESVIFINSQLENDKELFKKNEELLKNKKKHKKFIKIICIATINIEYFCKYSYLVNFIFTKFIRLIF
jgi:hypothetical protein